MKTDTTIRDDVLAELDFEPRVNAAAIGVGVADGVVTLSGHVPTYAEKVAAETAAKRVKGVKGIAMDIDVQLVAGHDHDDTEIARRATQLLAWTITAPTEGVKVKCENGWVTLSGQATWSYQKYEAERVVRNLAGVRGVFNHITLRNEVKPKAVRDQIKKALHRSAELDAAGIDVIVEGSHVTLTGRVSAWSDRKAAEAAAWSVPGVSQVIDDISVR